MNRKRNNQIPPNPIYRKFSCFFFFKRRRKKNKPSLLYSFFTIIKHIQAFFGEVGHIGVAEHCGGGYAVFVIFKLKNGQALKAYKQALRSV